MNYTDFLSGFYTALSFSSGIFFLTSRKLRAPFREAFGWLSVYSAIENLVCFIISSSGIGDLTTRELVSICLDTTTIPIITLLAATIVDQDMKTTPFSKRWMRVAMFEIPIIVSLGICAFSQYEWRELLAHLVLISNVVGVFTYSAYNLINYERRLPNDAKGRRASVKWMWNLVAMLAIEGVLYFGVEFYINISTYYLVLIAITCIATYFINKQSPIDTRQMFSADITQDAGHVSNTDNISTQHYLSRSEMRDRVKKFIDEHPKFEDGLAERAKQKLTTRDLFLCVMIIENKRIAEISELLSISPSSVEVARYRLRAKLSLNKGENLAKVLKSFL